MCRTPAGAWLITAWMQGLGRHAVEQLQPAQPQPPALEPVQAEVAHYYRFRERLQRGVILRRRARFTLEVAVHGETLLCYCPTTFMFLSGSRLNGEQARLQAPGTNLPLHTALHLHGLRTYSKLAHTVGNHHD